MSRTPDTDLIACQEKRVAIRRANLDDLKRQAAEAHAAGQTRKVDEALDGISQVAAHLRRDERELEEYRAGRWRQHEPDSPEALGHVVALQRRLGESNAATRAKLAQALRRRDGSARAQGRPIAAARGRRRSGRPAARRATSSRAGPDSGDSDPPGDEDPAGLEGHRAGDEA